jgi:serine/threonine-protein kinase HipA
MFCTIERFINGHWTPAATVQGNTEVGEGHLGTTLLEYLPTYAVTYSDRSDAAIACGYEVGFEFYREPTWPAFLLDLLPQGAGRRRILADLGVRPAQDGTAVDWQVLLSGAGYPIGNLRIAEALAPVPAHPHRGFTRNEILARHETFIEYAKSHGAPMAGSSGVQGEAPKFLLTVDAEGYWHGDGALPDVRARTHYLVKFPRGKTENDYRILRNEAGYYEAARWFGLRVGPSLLYENDVLFVRRFDRAVTHNTVERYGVESLYSLARVTDFGIPVSHDLLVGALAKYSSDPQADLVEYVMRDVLNVALLNTDNHGRNTAVLKKNGQIRLSPLYDFAPMFLDDAGIARVCRWEGNAEHGGIPIWGRVAERLGAHWSGVAPTVGGKLLRMRLADSADLVRALPDVMSRCGIEHDLIERLSGRIVEVANHLEDAAPAAIGVFQSPSP